MARSRWISDLHWVRTGQQTRSQKTQAALLDAAAVLFSEKGVDATSVADVAERAGCSVGAVYHHFRDKKALLYALVEQMGEEFRATTRDAVDPARWEGAKIGDILRGYLEFAVETGREGPSIRSAGQDAARNDPALREHLAELQTELSDALAALLGARRDEIGHPEPERAIDFVLDQLAAMLHTRVNPRVLPTRLANQPDERFVDEALRSACSYLRVAPSEEESP